MSSKSESVTSVALALLLHVALFASMLLAFDISRPMPAAAPAVIEGYLVSADLPQPQPRPEPPPVIEEPEPEPEPEIDRAAAEEAKRQQDLLLEQQRLEELERQREAEAQREREEQERKEREDRERREREAEAERQRLEREREENLRRQQEENERRRREEEEAILRAAMEAEERQRAARESNEMAEYVFRVGQKIRRNWVAPASTPADLRCNIHVRQSRSGDVLTVRVGVCNGDATVVRSIEAAVRKASPLPRPDNALLFDENLHLIFDPQE